MYLKDTLLACPACNCHARASANECPYCGASLRNADGTRTRTAAAALLGLALVATPAIACSGGVDVGSSEGTTSGSTSTSGAGGSTTSSGGMGGHPVATDYGVPATTTVSSSSSSSGHGGAIATDYGVPPTTAVSSSSGGTGGAGKQ